MISNFISIRNKARQLKRSFRCTLNYSPGTHYQRTEPPQYRDRTVECGPKTDPSAGRNVSTRAVSAPVPRKTPIFSFLHYHRRQFALHSQDRVLMKPYNLSSHAENKLTGTK